MSYYPGMFKTYSQSNKKTNKASNKPNTLYTQDSSCKHNELLTKHK